MAEKEVRNTVKKRAPHKTTAKTASSRASVTKTAPVRTRKAPTRIAEPVKRNRRTPKVILLGFFLFLVVLGISAAIGYSDKGALNVDRTISLRKENATPEEKVALDSVSTQKPSTVPNGGLVATNDTTPTPPPALESTATTSSTTASSTSANGAQATSTDQTQEATTASSTQAQ